MEKVSVWQEEVLLPTYPALAAEKNPMFLEKRAYQGSTGKVYPLPVTERLSDEKQDVAYKAVFLENEYLKVMILPELGGRIHRAYDKTNHYDFVYYNHVVKPALVGLTGPGSPAASSSTGPSTTAPPPIRRWISPLPRTRTAPAPST